MNIRNASLALAMTGLLAGCDSAPTDPQSKSASLAPVAAAASSAAPSPAAGPDQREAEKVVDAFASALTKGDWAAAASTWSPKAGVTAKSLSEDFSGPSLSLVNIGSDQGAFDSEGGALTYRVPMLLESPEGVRPLIVTLRRIERVPAASPAQRLWQIENAAQRE